MAAGRGKKDFKADGLTTSIICGMLILAFYRRLEIALVKVEENEKY